MDQIFFKTRSIFDVVRVAQKEPRRFGKRGELLVEFAEHEVGITTIILADAADDDDGRDGVGVGQGGGVIVKVDDDNENDGHGDHDDVEEGRRGRRRDGRGRKERRNE